MSSVKFLLFSFSKRMLTVSSRLQVWPAHKLVCGKKSHPFCLPPLTQEEADRAQRYLLEKTPNPQKQKLQFKLLAMCFGDMLGPRVRRSF